MFLNQQQIYDNDYEQRWRRHQRQQRRSQRREKKKLQQREEQQLYGYAYGTTSTNGGHSQIYGTASIRGRNSPNKMMMTMANCITCRNLLIVITILQFLLTVQRQVIDFLGQMWLPIIFNFATIIITIIGIFGAIHLRIPYLVLYALWCIVIQCWNLFLIAFYLQIGSLDRQANLHWLNLGTGSNSWWLANGPGCNPIYNLTGPSSGPIATDYESHVNDFGHTPIIDVYGCAFDYHVIESMQASIHALLAVIGFGLSGYIFYNRTSQNVAEEGIY